VNVRSRTGARAIAAPAAAAERAAALQDRIHQIIGEHCAWLGECSAEISRRLDEVQSHSEPTVGHILELRALVHQVTGSSGTMGFAEVSAAARALETALALLAGAGGRPDGAEVARLAGEPAMRLAQAVRRAEPSQSSLYHRELAPAGDA
jgi:HPt (histidine-containing phosphotransfer) domain-containing protein